MAMVTERDVWKTIFKRGWEISEFKDVMTPQIKILTKP